ncbi:MAG TPA: 30S ribosome-binding factor RbfA [Kofleriaceae bacterium]|nr:30S ribosome-binding factor RbfA [Kofleriaceae bacterium]
MSGPRKERVAEAIRGNLSEVIAREVKDPRVSAAGLVGVNHVEVNRDLSVARVYVSFFGGDSSEKAAARAMAGLESVAGFLRGHVARRLGLKRAPELRFLHDTSPDFRESLDEIRRQDAERGAAEPDATAATPDEDPSDDRGD